MKLTPKLEPGRASYTVRFRHKLRNGKVCPFSLSTADNATAHHICREVESLCQQPALVQEHVKLRGYMRRSVEIAYGDNVAQQVFGESKGPYLATEDAESIAKVLETAHELATGKKFLEPYLDRLGAPLSDFDGLSEIEIFKKLIDGYLLPKVSKLEERNKSLEQRIQILEPRVLEIETDNQRLRGQLNVHVKTSVGKAVEAWKEVYPNDRGQQTVYKAFRAVDSLVSVLPDRETTPLRDMTAGVIESWVEGLKKEDGSPMNPLTKRDLRAGVSVFMTWACKKFELDKNPMDRVEGVHGVAKNAEHIRAIRRFAELTSYLDSFKDHEYWRAWVAVAMLAGPRFSEQRRLKISNVYTGEDGDYIRIATILTAGEKKQGTKTGKERNVLIERSILLPILKEHIEYRTREINELRSSDSLKSQWLFPSTVGKGTVERKSALPGTWSSNSTWVRNFRNVLGEILGYKRPPRNENERKKDYRKRLRKHFNEFLSTKDEIWSYGPDEWRHCFGTALGNCGFSSLEISVYMGNREDVCRRHYVAPPKGKRWQLQYR